MLIFVPFVGDRYALATLGCVGLGWLVGPILGALVWRTSHSRIRENMLLKDKLFHDHIVKNRVDPSRQSVNNPVSRRRPMSLSRSPGGGVILIGVGRRFMRADRACF